MQTYFGPSAESKAHAQRRDAEIAAAPLDTPEQVATLPWHGNYASDAGLFSRVETFIRSRIAAGDIAGAKLASKLSSRHGMDMEEDDVSDAEFLKLFEEPQ